MPELPTPEPSDARILRILKEGYWDLNQVIELADGSLRVRKRNKGNSAPGPWGLESLRREIHYLRTLPARAEAVLPEVLACWDRKVNGAPDIGYEMPFYSAHTDAGELARRGELSQSEIDEFQQELADAVLERLHEPVTPGEPLSAHVVETIRQALDRLASDPHLARLINADAIQLNGRAALGPRVTLNSIIEKSDALAELDGVSSVRLHGDFFLENILWRSSVETAVDQRRLILVDPVSVAGIRYGPPLFDLVKYESYATGELLALRSEWVEVGGIEGSEGCYRWRVRWEEPALEPFKTRNWHSGFRRAYEAKYGEPDTRLYRLVDGYFSVAMALNTTGVQRQARLLKGTADLNAVFA